MKKLFTLILMILLFSAIGCKSDKSKDKESTIDKAKAENVITKENYVVAETDWNFTKQQKQQTQRFKITLNRSNIINIEAIPQDDEDG